MLVVISFYFASAAYGHAIVLYTTPGRRETVRGPDVPIKIRFNSRIDSKRSRLTLLTPDGNQTGLGIVKASSGDSLDVFRRRCCRDSRRSSIPAERGRGKLVP